MLQVEMAADGLVQPARRAAGSAPDLRAVDVGLASAEHSAAEAFGVVEALADAGDGLGEGLAARWAAEAPLLDGEPNLFSTEGRVFDDDGAAVVADLREGGAPGTD